MELKDKSFKNNKTGEIVRVVDSYQNITVMNNEERVDTSRLLDPLYYTEQTGSANHYTERVDPNEFLNNNARYDMFAKDISSVDTSKLPDEGGVGDYTEGGTQVNMGGDPTYRPATNESAVVQYDEEYEKQLLAEKYGATLDNDAVKRQNEAFDKILNPDVDGGVPAQPNKPSGRVEVNGVQQREVKREYIQPDYVDPRAEPVVKSDPIIDMFKNVKRKEKFLMSLDIEDRIPRIDFIEMMEDSYETSLVEYLADDILNKVLKDPNILRDKIIGEIEKLVYPDGKPVEEVVVEEVVEEEADEVVEEEVVEVVEIIDEVEEVIEESEVSEVEEIEKEEVETIDEVEEVIEESDNPSTKRPVMTPEYLDKESRTIKYDVNGDEVTDTETPRPTLKPEKLGDHVPKKESEKK